MEFHKNIYSNKKPEIITKKQISPTAGIIPSRSQPIIPTMKQFQIQEQVLTEKNINNNENINENVREKINGKDMPVPIKKYPSSSLAINLLPKYRIKRPMKKYYNQIRNPNPLKQMEYQKQVQSLHSSLKSNPNSIIANYNNSSKNNSKEKISNSPLVSPLHVYHSANNFNNMNNNEYEIEINDDEETTPKVRYHRHKKNTPIIAYNNKDNEEIIYNVPLTDEESIGKNNFNINNNYFDAYEVNEGMDPVQVKIPNINYVRNDNLVCGNPFLYSSEENSVKYEEDKKNREPKKKLVRKYTDVYDPNKNKKGILLPKTKMTVPLIEPFSDEKEIYFNRNSKLSDLIMTRKKYSPDPVNMGYEEFFSGSEDKTTCQNETKIRNLKTFNRRSFEKFTENKKSIKMHKSPEERFKNFSLAMISSMGKNTENRPIYRRMRLDKGGVVDLAQDDGKKNRFKYLIKKMNRSPKQLVHNNPKYREKAAELIQDWWYAIKEYRKQRIKSAILIQSYFRGRFTRKYLYDVIYMNYLYFGFCKKIEKFILKKYGPYFLENLFSKFVKKYKNLKNLIFHKERKKLKLYLYKWKIITKENNRKKLALLYILRIRALRESKMFNLKRVFSKWNYIAIIQKERSNSKDIQRPKKFMDDRDEKNEEITKLDIDKIKDDNTRKIRGVLQILGGTNSFIKKKVIEIINPKIRDYLSQTIKEDKLKRLLEIKEKIEFIILRKYFYIYYEKCFDDEINNKKTKKKKYIQYLDYNDLYEKLDKMEKEIDILKKIKTELFVKKIESYLSDKQKLRNLFLSSTLLRVKKKKKLTKEDLPSEESKKKKSKKIISKEEDQDLTSYEEEEEDEDEEINKKAKKIGKKYIAKEDKKKEKKKPKEEIIEMGKFKSKKYTKKIIRKGPDETEEESEEDQTEKNNNKKKINKKEDKKSFKAKEKSSPSVEEDEEIEPKKQKIIKNKDKNDQIEKEDNRNSKVYTKKKVKNDKKNIKEKERDNFSSDEEINKANKKAQKDINYKKRKYRRKSDSNEIEGTSEEEEVEEVEDDTKKKEKQRSSSLYRISEKSKEISDYIKENSSLSDDDSQKRNKLRPYPEKTKNIKKIKNNQQKLEKEEEKGNTKDKNITNKKVKKEEENESEGENISDKNKYKKKIIKKGNKEPEQIENKEEKNKKIRKNKKTVSESEEEFEEEEEDSINRNKKDEKQNKKINKEKEKIKKKNEKEKDNNLEEFDNGKSKQLLHLEKKYALKNILKIKKFKNEKLIRHYLNIWKFSKYKTSSPEMNQYNININKKFGSKILYIFAKNLEKKILIKKFNYWRRINNNISTPEKKDISINNQKDKNKLKNLIYSKIKKDNNSKLKYKFNEWKILTKDSFKKVVIIQNMFRQFLSRNKLENLKRLNDILLDILNNLEKSENYFLIYYLRKWNSISKKISCIKKIMLLQKYFKLYLNSKQNNKYKTFFENMYKYKLINSLNEIAKYNLFKLSIAYIAKNRVISLIYEKIKKNKIMILLDKIIKNIDIKNRKVKMKYYVDKWNNRVNYIKNKDNKKLKVLLMRIFNKKDNLNNLLKSYFLRWKRIANLISIINSVIKIQNNWRKKQSIDNYINKKKEQDKFFNMLKIIDNKYKLNNFSSFINKIKDINKKYLLNKIENDFTQKRNNTLKYVFDKVKNYLKNKYLSKSLKFAENGKNRIIGKYFCIWKNKTINANKIYKYLNKFIEKKDKKNKGLVLSALLKWLYHSKLNTMKEKVDIIQKKYRNFKNNSDSINNWKKLKNILYNKKNKKEIKEIINKIKTYKSINLIKSYIKNKIKKKIFNDLKHYNNISLFIKIMKKILTQITETKSSKSLKNYFIIWKNNINKEIEREEKLNELLYTIEKRMTINSAKFLSYISLLKRIFDGLVKIRKYEYFMKLKKFAERNKNMNSLSKSLSSAYNNLKLQKEKNILTKILKYIVYKALLNLFEKIKQKQSKQLKNYKKLFMENLKKFVNSDNNNIKKKQNSQKGKMLFKPKPKIGGMKTMNKAKNKSQGVIKVNLIKNDQKKDKNNNKGQIRKNGIAKGSFKKFKKENSNDKIKIHSKSEEESENETENEAIIKENLNYLFNVISQILTENKRELLYMFREKVSKIKTEKEKKEEKEYYSKKLYKIIKYLAIKKIFIQKQEISRAKKLINLIKLTAINSQISSDRWIRQLIRRWRFISFVKNVSKKKMELMYKNLHIGYLEIINSLFNNQSQFPSMIKQFENFGADIGMYKNSDYVMNKEKELYQRVKKKYISKPIEYDRENSLKIDSGNFINDLKYKSDEGEDTDAYILDSDKDILNRQKKRISKNYDWDK